MKTDTPWRFFVMCAAGAVALLFVTSCGAPSPNSGLGITNDTSGAFRLIYLACKGDFLTSIEVDDSKGATVWKVSRGAVGAKIAQATLGTNPPGWEVAQGNWPSQLNRGEIFVEITTQQRTPGRLRVDVTGLRPGLIASDAGPMTMEAFRSTRNYCAR